jgi:O-antigen/teichoic acid export membrane protein
MVLTPQTDVLVVGALLTKDMAGAYGAASQLAALVGFGVGAVGAIGMPMIAQLYAEGKREDLARLIRHYSRINLAVSVPVLAVIAVLGGRLLGAYGKEFAVAYPVLLILSATQIVNAAVGVQAGYLLTMTGRERAAGRIVGISALTNLGLTAVLTPWLGIPGAASATLLATITRSVLLARHIRRELDINLFGLILGVFRR